MLLQRWLAVSSVFAVGARGRAIYVDRTGLAFRRVLNQTTLFHNATKLFCVSSVRRNAAQAVRRGLLACVEADGSVDFRQQFCGSKLYTLGKL